MSVSFLSFCNWAVLVTSDEAKTRYTETRYTAWLFFFIFFNYCRSITVQIKHKKAMKENGHQPTSMKNHILWKLHVQTWRKKQQTTCFHSQWWNNSWTFAPCTWVRMQTRFLFNRVSEFAAETSTSARSTASGHVVPIRLTRGTVTQMMAAHDESESTRQWEDRQGWASPLWALDDSNSFQKKRLYIVFITQAHFLIN